MNSHEEYEVALELASTSRYREAENKLKHIIDKQPGNVDALILHAKVKYYLRKYAASKAAFETVLLYDPKNSSAYFGLQYFTERQRTVRNTIFFLLAILILVVMGIGIYTGLRLSFATRFAGVFQEIHNIEEKLHRDMVGLELSVIDYVSHQQAAEERYLRELEKLTVLLEQTTERLERFRRETQDHLTMLDSSIVHQNEVYETLFNIIEGLFSEMRDLRSGGFLF